MTAAIVAALFGAVLLWVYAQVRDYGEHRWSKLLQDIIGFGLLGLGVVGLEDASDKPAFALVGIAVVVVAYRIAASRRSNSATDDRGSR